MSALTSASKIVCEWLWNNYSDMSSDSPRAEDWIDVKDFAEQECQNWLEGEYEMPEDSDEMYPPWVTLIVTRAINAQIQWADIQTIICERHNALNDD
jgi:hypothetical protein